MSKPRITVTDVDGPPPDAIDLAELARGPNFEARLRDQLGAACACQRVKYDPKDNGNGTVSERWRCTDCGSEFVKALKLGEWQDCARQKQEIIDSETALRKEAESRLDALTLEHMNLKSDHAREVFKLREALECLLPGLILDLRYADPDDDRDAMQSRIKTVTDALQDEVVEKPILKDGERFGMDGKQYIARSLEALEAIGEPLKAAERELLKNSESIESLFRKGLPSCQKCGKPSAALTNGYCDPCIGLVFAPPSE